MAKVLLDASAVLVLLQSEPGYEVVRAALRDDECFITAANLAEVAGKLHQVLNDMEKVRRLVDLPNVQVLPVTEEDAFKAAELAIPGKALGLSLGDRLCLAAALLEGAEVLTSDLAWLELNLPGLKVRPVRAHKGTTPAAGPASPSKKKGPKA